MVEPNPSAELLAAEAEICKRSFHEFFRTFWPILYQGTPLEENWHIGYLCDELQKVGEKVIAGEPFDYNAIINISPGETKSTISTIMFPAWLWCRAPHLKVITASYSQGLAIQHSTASRDIISSELYKACFPEVELRRDMQAKTIYGNTSSGQRITASTGSAVTGKHAHIIIVDDPINVEQSTSEAERETANRWLKTTLPSRKTDVETAPTVLIMQRLHEEDPTAVMAEVWERQGKIKHIRLPSDDRYTISPPELVDNYTQDGGMKVMNPLRRGEKVLKDFESISAQMYAGQFGQDPKPAEGNILKKAWFTQRISLSNLQALADELDKPLTWCATVDGAYTKETKNSATGALVWAILGGKLYIRDYRQFWLEFPELIKQLPEFVQAAGVDPVRGMVYVEAKATGKSLVQTLGRAGGINIIEDTLPLGVTRQAGKVMRVEGITNFCKAGNVVLVEGADWGPFVSQLAVFPAGSHDDLVDDLVMAVEKVEGSYSLDAWNDALK